jgi:uncharacterized protein YndB with AHSA1/START domain
MPQSIDPAGRFEQSLFIAAKPAAVFALFFDHTALKVWWQAVRSVVTPVPFGVYAVEWAQTPYRDDLLGPLGGVFHGTVVDVRPDQQFLVADCWWVPPEGDPLGPMALHVSCQHEGDGCRLTVRQDGYDPSPRWRRYYAVVSRGWQLSLTALRRHAEGTKGPEAAGPESKVLNP